METQAQILPKTQYFGKSSLLRCPKSGQKKPDLNKNFVDYDVSANGLIPLTSYSKTKSVLEYEVNY